MGNCSTCQNCNEGKTEFNDYDDTVNPRQSITTLQAQNKNYQSKTNTKYVRTVCDMKDDFYSKGR